MPPIIEEPNEEELSNDPLILKEQIAKLKLENHSLQLANQYLKLTNFSLLEKLSRQERRYMIKLYRCCQLLVQENTEKNIAYFLCLLLLCPLPIKLIFTGSVVYSNLTTVKGEAQKSQEEKNEQQSCEFNFNENDDGEFIVIDK